MVWTLLHSVSEHTELRSLQQGLGSARLQDIRGIVILPHIMFSVMMSGGVPALLRWERS